jgi:hypothetical protein
MALSHSIRSIVAGVFGIKHAVITSFIVSVTALKNKNKFHLK